VTQLANHRTGRTGRTGRERSAEPAERSRTELQRAGRCIKCKRPSKTQRCKRCASQVEANTERYHGAGKQGPPTKLESSVLDLRLGTEAASRAFTGFGEVMRRELAPKFQDDALAEHLAQAWLAERLLREVRLRHRSAPPQQPRQPARPHPQLAFPFWYMGAR
jgi:hypothetical protein